MMCKGCPKSVPPFIRKPQGVPVLFRFNLINVAMLSAKSNPNGPLKKCLIQM